MTVKELSQLYWLNREIEMDKERLSDLEGLVTSISSPELSGMSRAPGGCDKISKYVAEILDLKAIIAAKQIQCIHERGRLERYIADVPDSLTRQVLTLRFINGLSWDQVAAHVGGGNTVDGVKKRCYRYLDSTERK